MDELKGSVKDFRGLFKTPKENTSLVSANTLHQQICLTAKDQFEATKGECCSHGLDFISNWITRAQGNYRSIQLPNTV